MIITRIAASNAFKYAKLDISDIPQKGVIAISGDNEAGKSSIGEIICFALFGKTFSLAEEDLEKAIRWGEHNCSLTVGFSVGDDAEYEVFRFLDEEKKLGARLSVKGEETPMVTGMHQVTDAICDLIGFDFNEFLETFYLAQREIIKPHPHSEALKSIAGLTVLEQISEELENQNDDDGASSEELQQRISEINTELSELNIDKGLISELEQEKSAITSSSERIQNATRELDSAADNYREALEETGATGSGGGLYGFLKLALLLCVVAFGVAWFMVTQQPNAELTTKITPFLSANGIDAQMLMFGAAGPGVLFVVLWIIGNPAENRSKKLQPVAEVLAAKIRETWTIKGDGMDDAPLDDERINRFADRMDAGLGALEEVDEVVEIELARLRSGLETEQNRLAEIDDQISNENSRCETSDQLILEKNELDQQVSAIVKLHKVREISQRLLKGASNHVVKRFNSDLREFAARTLPLFTGNRYEHLRVEDDLNVRVFSNRKRDFMDLSEISAGTQRQIMLALRLALAKELADTAVVGSQFMFLDEPFAFFDETRTRDTLKVLLDISDKVSQVWVVNQEYSADQEFALHIQCDDSSDNLIHPAPIA